jgi:hypothetical protein
MRAVPIAASPRQIVPVVLSFDSANYTKWAIFMRATLGHAGLLGHINGTIAAAPTDSKWMIADYTVLNVLHSAIDEDVVDMLLARDQTARQLWLAALELFSVNKASKAIYLDNDFRQLIQGDQSIIAYLCRQKQLADALVDNDSPVSAGPSSSTLSAASGLDSPLPPPSSP